MSWLSHVLDVDARCSPCDGSWMMGFTLCLQDVKACHEVMTFLCIHLVAVASLARTPLYVEDYITVVGMARSTAAQTSVLSTIKASITARVLMWGIADVTVNSVAITSLVADTSPIGCDVTVGVPIECVVMRCAIILCAVCTGERRQHHCRLR